MGADEGLKIFNKLCSHLLIKDLAKLHTDETKQVLINNVWCNPIKYKIVPHINKLPIIKPDDKGVYYYMHVNDSTLISDLSAPLLSDTYYAPVNE